MLDQYIAKGQRLLRCGYTTGSCAAMAAGAAAELLLGGVCPPAARLVTPGGVAVEAPTEQAHLEGDTAVCAVRKDAGDDPDVTDGILVFARVCRRNQQGVAVDGGEGVGRVTRRGLDQPVGQAAVNRVPREMIARAAGEACARYGYSGGLSVTICVPGGAALAAKTFNPVLGIEGGISILGTSGIVEPQSERALIDSIEVEIKMLAADRRRGLVLTPGNYGEAFLRGCPALRDLPAVKCANFIGDTLDLCVRHNMGTVVLVGHIGKLVKLAGGVMNTHSAWADCRMEILAAHAAIHGASRETATALMDAVTTDEAIGILDGAGLREQVLKTVLERIRHHVGRRAGQLRTGVLLFSNHYGRLGETAGTSALLEELAGQGES